MKVKKNSKLFKELQDTEISSSISVCDKSKWKLVDRRACILRDIADKLVELADMLDGEVRQ